MSATTAIPASPGGFSAAALARLSVVCQNDPGGAGSRRQQKCLNSGIVAVNPATGQYTAGPTLQAILGGQAQLPPATVQGQTVPAGSTVTPAGSSGGLSIGWILIIAVGAWLIFK